MTSQTLIPTDARLSWTGCVGLETTPDGTIARRLPPFSRELFPSDDTDALWRLSAMPAGVRLSLQTDSPFIGGRYTANSELKPLDIVCGGELLASLLLNAGDEFRFDGLPAGHKTIELWLPQGGVFQLRELFVAPDAAVSPVPDTRPKWVTYGSSITHAGGAHSPTRTWPALVARENDVNLTCLGFSGNCHLEPMIARVMRDLPADFISICAGINISRGSYSQRTFRAALIGFVQVIREKHPTTPLALISPIYSPPRETPTEAAPSLVGWTLPMMRQEVQAAVVALQTHGDEAIFYVDGLDIVGPNEAHIMPDELHPDADGQFVVAANFNRTVASRLFAGRSG